VDRRFTFIQIAAPSRTDIPEYKRFDEDVPARRAASTSASPRRWKPIILLVEHHEPDSVYEYYRGDQVASSRASTTA
jgi:trehalose 6-phosphate synthase